MTGEPPRARAARFGPAHALAAIVLLLAIVALARTTDGWIRWASGPAFYPRLDQAARERLVAGAHGARLRGLLAAIPPDAGIIWVADQLSDEDWLGMYTLRPRPARLASPAELQDPSARQRFAREGWRFAVLGLSAVTLPDLSPILESPSGTSPREPVVFPAAGVSLRGWLALLLTAVAALGFGSALTGPLLSKERLRIPWSGRLGLALVSGLGILGTLGFLAAFIGLAGSLSLHIVLVAAGLALLLLGGRPLSRWWPEVDPPHAPGHEPARPDPIQDLWGRHWKRLPARAFGVVIALMLLLPAVRAISEPMHHWDERFQWAFKAKVLSEEGGIGGPTFGGADRPHLHRHYPLLLPALEAQVATLAGGFEQERAVKGLFPLFLAGLVLTGHGLFRMSLGPSTAAACTMLLAALPPLHHATRIQGGPAHTGFADLPLGAFLGGAALLIRAGGHRPAGAILAGLFAGWAALCKPEGIVLLLAVPIGVLLAAPRDTPTPADRGARLHLAAGALLAAAVVVLPRLLLSWLVPAAGTAGYTGDEDYLSRLRPDRVVAGLMENAGTALPALLGAPFTARWAWMGTLPILGGLLTWRRARALPLLPLILIPLAADALAYVLTGSTITWHLAVSLDRLWLQLLVPTFGIVAVQVEAAGAPTAS